MRPSSPGARHRRGNRSPSSPLRIVAIYGVLGLAWAALSERLVRALVEDPRLHEALQAASGALLVLATAIVLWVLVLRGARDPRDPDADVRAAFDGMADAVLLADGSGIVDANRAALRLLRAEGKEEVLGPLAEWSARWALRSPDGEAIPFERCAGVRAVADELRPPCDAVLRRADGADVFVSVSASGVQGPGGRTLVVTVLRDASPARHLDEAREEFLAAAAHEFKTPLAVIKAYAQLMARREPAETRALAVIQRQVDRLSSLVQHLLDASRLRLDASDGRAERFDLAALAGEVVERARGAAPRHELRVGASAPIVVRGDRERIARVIAALVENGVRFSPAGGTVETLVEADGAEVRVSVRDHGLGIPRERQDRIFDRYYRAHAGAPEDPGGLGVGLDVSRRIVLRHGGRMWFESAPGEGSTFHFTLPLAEARA